MVWLLMELGHSWPHCVTSRSIFIVIALWWTSQRKPVLVIHEDVLLKKNLSLSHFYPPGWTIIIPYYFVVYHIWVRCCQNCHVYIYTLICKWHVIYYTLTQNKYYLHLWTLQTKCWMRSTYSTSGCQEEVKNLMSLCNPAPWVLLGIFGTILLLGFLTFYDTWNLLNIYLVLKIPTFIWGSLQ